MQNEIQPGLDPASPFLTASSFWIPHWIPEVSAWLEHGPFALWLVEVHRPACIVELGSHWGYSYMAFCQAVQAHQISAKCYAVDTWRGDEHAGFYADEVYSRLAEYNRQQYGSFSAMVRSTFDEAAPHFADGSIDLLHIDGLHTYEAAKHDFETWSPKLSERAVVLFHDINVRERGFGLWQLWEELAANSPHFSFHHGHGLGVLGVGKALPPLLERLFAIPDNSEAGRAVQHRYARLGGSVTGVQIAHQNASLQSDLQVSRSSVESLRSEIVGLKADNGRLFAHRLELIKLQAVTLREIEAHKSNHASKLSLHHQKAAAERKNLQHLLESVQKKLKKALSKSKLLSDQVDQQQKVIRSAQNWQQKSWFKRAFHHWKSPKIKLKKSASSTVSKETPPLSANTTSPAAPDQQPLPQPNLNVAVDQSSRVSVPNRPTQIPRALATPVVDRSAGNFRTIFSESYYLEQHPQLEGAITPVRHYETIGWKLGLDPHPMFDVSYYLENNPDLLEKGVEPLLHYLSIGWLEGKDPHPFFRSSWYLATYLDVARAGLEPLSHYLNRGWKEGRMPHPSGDGDWWVEFERNRKGKNYLFPEETLDSEVVLRLEMLNPDKKNILIVTHDTSRTGAPILVLNLIARFRATYNVIAFALRKGTLDAEYDAASDVFISADLRSDSSNGTASRCLQQLLGRCHLEFALVNSIESTPILAVLSRNDLPVVQMVHEFAAYTRPRDTIRRAAFLTSATVFSAGIVHENALRECPEMAHRERLVAPQGLCNAPVSADNEDDLLKERNRIQKNLRPEGWEEAIVVLGMGTVQLRKGIDLFFLCAERVIRNNPGRKVRFVWIGHGFDTTKDLYFSVYLADQLQRLNLGDSACLMDEISQLHHAYQLADFFFLSSRLDPLPVVSQEAMFHRLPVICFENAVGTAETLAKNPETARCIVPYLDVEAAAVAIQSMIDDSTLREIVGENCRKLVEQYFDMDQYVGFLNQTALEAAERKVQEIADAKTIKDSGLLDLSFLLSPTLHAIASRPIWWFIRSWVSGITLRKPFPGFHPGIYAERNGIKGRDPTVHYIEAGQPAGPWRMEVIESVAPSQTTVVADAVQPRVALHLHLYYLDMAADLFKRIAAIQMPMDLLISVDSLEAAGEVETLSESHRGGSVEIRVVPNRGRDIGPLLTEFGRTIVERYDIIGHVHTKRSLDVNSPDFIEDWADFLYENVLGGKHPMADRILGRMIAEPSIGLVFPDDPYIVGWSKNFEHAVVLLQRLGITENQLPQAINFPVGTMFWARTAAIQPLLDLYFQWADYPPEPLPYDGTLLHSIERLLPIIAENAGFRCAVTYVAGVTR